MEPGGQQGETVTQPHRAAAVGIRIHYGTGAIAKAKAKAKATMLREELCSGPSRVDFRRDVLCCVEGIT